MGVARIGMEATGDQTAIEAIDAAAVGEDDIANRLTIGERVGVGGSYGIR